MSSLPGYTLEDYISWQWDVVAPSVDGNVSLRIAEGLGMPSRRKAITAVQFQRIVAIYEPLRHYVEKRLDEFDDESQSMARLCGLRVQ